MSASASLGGDAHMAREEPGSAIAACIGSWRIVEADLWDREYLDLVEPARIAFHADGRGEMAFGCVDVRLDCEHGQRAVFFRFDGFDEMDEVSGDGAAEIEDDGTLDIEIRFHLGDKAELKARPE